MYSLEIMGPTMLFIGERGFGFRFVDSFSMKLWKLRAKDSIWSEFMYRKYIRYNHPMLVRSQVGSPTWKRLLHIRERAKEYIFWILGDGMLDFWRDKWAAEKSLQDLLGVVVHLPSL